MEQKIIQVGNSLAVTLPTKFAKARKLKAGQKVYVEADPEIDTIYVKTKSNGTPTLTPEFKQWLDKVSFKYENVIKELAKK